LRRARAAQQAPCAAGAFSAAGAASCAFTASTCPAGTYASGAASCVGCYPATACAVAGLRAQPPCLWFASTLAGGGGGGFANGFGTSALFNGPVGLAEGAAGALFVVDKVGSTVRSVAVAGNVTTLAGSNGNTGSVDATGTSARFDFWAGFFWGGAAFHPPSGAVFVSDVNNGRVRAISPAGVVETLAAGFYVPQGLAVVGDTVFIADMGNSAIMALALLSGAVATHAGRRFTSGFSDGAGTNALFNNPVALAADPRSAAASVTLYVGDASNNRLRKVSPLGVVSTLSADYGPISLSVDQLGNVWYSRGGCTGLFFFTEAKSIQSQILQG